ncbi:MAG TPA: MFS transporter [Alphaproteobacteria bacterium]|nr:MFS transporter [Alphaproteobacteria bacterium]
MDARAKTTADTADLTPPSNRTLLATYGAGLTTNAFTLMLKVVVPLWALRLDMSPTMIGIAVGAGGLLPFLLSIHGGVLMDKFGTRRVNVVFALAAASSVALFPFLPWASAVIALQLVTGLSSNIGWMGAQALIVQYAPGDTTAIARFSMASRLGNLVAPMFTGYVWDAAGPTGTFLFVALWPLLTFVCLLLMPPTYTDIQGAGHRVGVRDIFPRLSDYLQAFAMMAVPAVTFIVVLTYVRIGSSAIQSSFYVVYLENIGLSGLFIGVLIGIGEGFGMFGAGVAGWIEKRLKPHWTLILFIAISVAAVCLTPMVSGFTALLVLFSAIRGNAQGLSQPVMFAILSRAVDPREQGRSIGLRTTANRLATMTIPPAMGILIDAVGLDASFYWTGVILVAICIIVALVVRRLPGFQA